MEDTSGVEEDTISSVGETMLAPPGAPPMYSVPMSQDSQPCLSSEMCSSFMNSAHGNNVTITSTPMTNEDKPTNSVINQIGNPNGLQQIRVTQAVPKHSMLSMGVTKSGTLPSSPNVSSTPVRVVTLQKVDSALFNKQCSSPQQTGLTTQPNRIATPDPQQTVLHLTANQKGSPCYTKVFQCSPGNLRVGQPQTASPSRLPTTLTVLRGTGTTLLVNGVPATSVTTMTSQPQYVANASPSKDYKRDKQSHVKRPMNAFMVWARYYRQTLSRQMLHASNTDVSVLLGRIWNNMSDKDKRPFYEEAGTLKMEHRINHPGWVYKPRRHKAWESPTTSPSSPNLTGSPTTTRQSGSNSIQPTPADTYHQPSTLHSSIIMSPEALNPKASFYKEPGNVVCSPSPQTAAAASPKFGPMIKSPIIRASPVSTQLESISGSQIRASPVLISQSSPQLRSLPGSPMVRCRPVSISQSSPNLDTKSNSPVIRAWNVSISQGSPQLECMPRSPIIRLNTFPVSQSSPHQNSMHRRPLIRASWGPGPPSVPQVITTMWNGPGHASKPLSSSITNQSNQLVQVIRGPGMVAGSAANMATSGTGFSTQGNIVIRNSSGMCQTVPVRIGFRPTLRPVIAAPTPAPNVCLTSPEKSQVKNLQCEFIRTSNLTCTTSSNPSRGTPAALGQPPGGQPSPSLQRNIVAMARTPHPVTQTLTTSKPLSVTNSSICHTTSTKHLMGNESRPSVTKKPPPLRLPIYNSAGVSNGVSRVRMSHQPPFVPITVPQIPPEKPGISELGDKCSTACESMKLQTNVKMSDVPAVRVGGVQQPGGQSLEDRTPMDVTQDLKNPVAVSTMRQSPVKLECQTNLSTATNPHQPLLLPSPKTQPQYVVHSKPAKQPGTVTNPTYSIRAPIHSPAIIPREHPYSRTAHQIQGQTHFRLSTEDQIKFTPVSSVKQFEPEWWYLPFSPYPLDDLRPQTTQGAGAGTFTQVVNADFDSGDDSKEGDDANDGVQFYGESTQWEDYCDPYNPAYFDSLNTQQTELCGNIPSLNMQGWTSYLDGPVEEDTGTTLGEPPSNKSIDIASHRSVIGDQKNFIENHEDLLMDPVSIQQCPVQSSSQPQLNQMPGQCQFIPQSGPLSSFVRGGRTYHVLQQHPPAPYDAALMPYSSATTAGCNAHSLPPRKKTRQH